MSLESGNWIKDLQPLNPPATDPVSEGNDHLKLIKKVLKNAFPSDIEEPMIPDLSGHDGDFLRVKEDGTGFEWTDPTPTGSAFEQAMIRPIFSMTDNAKLNISVGEWWIPGKSKYCKSAGANEVTFPVGTSANYQWYYVYIDETKISDNEIPSDGIYATDTAPDTASYNGHYLGNDRCIFACVKGKDGESMINVYHDGGDYVLLGESLSASTGTPEEYRIPGDNVWHDVDIHLPAFTTKGYVQYYFDSLTGADNSTEWYYRPSGETSEGQFIGRNDGYNAEFSFNSFPTFLGAGNKIQLKGTVVTSTLQPMTSGYYLPRGM